MGPPQRRVDRLGAKGAQCVVSINQEGWPADQDNSKACPAKTRDPGVPSSPYTTQQTTAELSRQQSLAGVTLQAPRVLSEPPPSAPRQLSCFIQLHRTGWWLLWFYVFRAGERTQVPVPG